MNMYLSKQSALSGLRTIFCTGVAFLYVFLSTGCSRVTKDEISGVYICSKDGVVDTIELNTNGSFTQKITFGNEEPWTIHGFWTLNTETVELDRFYLSFDLGNHLKVIRIIPPHEYSMGVLWIERGQLKRELGETLPFWIKQTNNPTSTRVEGKPGENEGFHLLSGQRLELNMPTNRMHDVKK